MATSRMVVNYMGSACALPSVVLWFSRAPSVVADHNLCSLCKSLFSDWNFYPTFFNSVTVLPSDVYGIRPFNAGVNSFTACNTPSSGDTVVFVMCLCFKNTVSEIRSALMCVYSRPQNTYRGVEMSGGTICQLSGHPKFSACSVFREFALHNLSVPMASDWNHVAQTRRPVLKLLVPHLTGGGYYIWVLLMGSNYPTDSL